MKRIISTFLILLSFFVLNPLSVQASERKLKGATDTHLEYTFLDSYDGSREFVDYHPESSEWSYASSYSVSNSYTVTASITKGSKDGMSAQLSKSKATSVGVTINADSSRMSRLGVYATFRYSTYELRKIDNSSGTVLSTWETTVKTPIKTYLIVVYD